MIKVLSEDNQICGEKNSIDPNNFTEKKGDCKYAVYTIFCSTSSE